MRQHRALLRNLRMNQRLPYPLARGLSGSNLGPMPLGHDMVGVKWQHHANRQMIAPSHHDRRANRKQFQENRLSVGGASVVDNHHSQILDRNGRPW